MNNFVLRFYGQDLSDMLSTLTTPLLDAGAEFAKFVPKTKPRYLAHESACRLIKLASPVGFIDGKLKAARYFGLR